MSQMDKKKKFNPAETPIVLGEPQNYARAMISEVLRNLGYQRVFPATNAAEIVEAMNVWHPHVVIMENLLPDMQGTQLVHQFREVGRRSTALCMCSPKYVTLCHIVELFLPRVGLPRAKPPRPRAQPGADAFKGSPKIGTR